jgi:uncharacterized protein
MSLVLKKLEQFWWHITDDNCIDVPLTTVSQENMLGEKPIHIAAWRGDEDDLSWLIENGADVNSVGDLGMTPLHYAYLGRKPANVAILLHAGADPSRRCDRGLLPRDTHADG